MKLPCCGRQAKGPVKVGSIGVCLYCAVPLRYTKTEIERVTEAEVQKLSKVERAALDLTRAGVRMARDLNRRYQS